MNNSLPSAVLAFILLALIARFVSVFIHEMGHAIAALLTTGKGAEVYVGSYGDPTNSFHIRLGPFNIWFKYSFKEWAGGLCKTKATDISFTKELIFTVAGPLASLILAFITLRVVVGKYEPFPLSLASIFFFVFFSALVDFIGSAIPRKFASRQGKQFYTDGYHIIRLMKRMKHSQGYSVAIGHLQNKEYKKAGDHLAMLIENGWKDEDLCRLCYAVYIQAKEYEQAFLYQQIFEKEYAATADDYANFSILYSKLGEIEKAKDYLNKGLILDPSHPLLLNNMGYWLTTQNKFAEALPYLEKAVKVDSNGAFAYNNLGHAKMETGDLQGGLEDIKKSIELDSTNAYAFRNLGIYHLKTGNKEDAKRLLLKAKEMDAETPLVDSLLESLSTVS